MCSGHSERMHSQQKCFHVSLKMVEKAKEHFVGQQKGKLFGRQFREEQQQKYCILFSFNENFEFLYGLALSYVNKHHQSKHSQKRLKGFIRIQH